MRACFPTALWIDLLQPDVLRQYLAKPERLIDVVRAHTANIIVIDEIQKVPSLLSLIHALIEEKKGYQFILTGSSARKLKQTGADLLGGRASYCTLHPFMASELGEQFSLTRALQYGLLPLVWNETIPMSVLHAYVHLYLQEEIQVEGLVRNIENFSRFLEVISFSQGALLNISNISRECGVKRKTVESYINILDNLLLSFQLTVFSKRAQRKLVEHPKFYLFDAGVFQAIRPRGLLDSTEEIGGSALEGLVAQNLRAWIDYSGTSYTLNFWRTRSKLEVDFIVYGEAGFWAIEVKSSDKVNSKDLKSLKAFLVDYPMSKAIFLYQGSERLYVDNILCLPVEEFLIQLKPNEPLWI
jgi:predicted AAA+ superfamily ATPase